MFIHSQKRNPQTHLKDPNMVWDFFANHPMTVHQVGLVFFYTFTNVSPSSFSFSIPIVVYPMAFVSCMATDHTLSKWSTIATNSSG
jgi:hypothetical protein